MLFVKRPVLLIKLKAAEPKVVYSPSLREIREYLLKCFQTITHAATNLPRVSRSAQPLLWVKEKFRSPCEQCFQGLANNHFVWRSLMILHELDGKAIMCKLPNLSNYWNSANLLSFMRVSPNVPWSWTSNMGSLIGTWFRKYKENLNSENISIILFNFLLGGDRALPRHGKSANLHSQRQFPRGPRFQVYRSFHPRLPPKFHWPTALPRLLSTLRQPPQQ